MYVILFITSFFLSVILHESIIWKFYACKIHRTKLTLLLLWLFIWEYKINKAQDLYYCHYPEAANIKKIWYHGWFDIMVCQIGNLDRNLFTFARIFFFSTNGKFESDVNAVPYLLFLHFIYIFHMKIFRGKNREILEKCQIYV